MVSQILNFIQFIYLISLIGNKINDQLIFYFILKEKINFTIISNYVKF